ncbi:hypothetical protein EV360DRAFT_37272 [Lentinula raphanica]|nr:hypothetical protein EV360DRAFT_37272 [Lentinula raphanica]
MSTASTTISSSRQLPQQVSSRNLNRGGRGGRAQGNKGRGRGGRSGRTTDAGEKKDSRHDHEPQEEKLKTDTSIEAPSSVIAADDAEIEGDVCWICAEPVKYYSLSACNHRTCHVCALRLRALYKKDVCTFCKEPQPEVIFTTSSDKPFSEYANDLSSSTEGSNPKLYDPKLRVTFETQEMMTESLILLRFNCPDSECDYIAKGWGDLKMHVRASHGRLMCDLCIRSKKVFAHEHVLYTYQQLRVHLPSINNTTNQPEGGIHPLCEFCRECFAGDDDLYSHMRERHEECFICKRDGVRDQYFASYPDLEYHFSSAHFACSHSVCMQRKFVVFGSALDLQAHMVEEHGASRKVVGIEFAGVRDITSNTNSGRSNREPLSREQPPLLPPPAPPQNQTRRRQAFGGALTNGGAATTGGPVAANANAQSGSSRRVSPAPGDASVDPAVADRHTAFLTLLSNLAPNPSSAMAAVKAAARGYRAGESTARDLIGIVWNVLDVSKDKGLGRSSTEGLEPTARVINSFVDLLEEDEEKEGVAEKDKKSLELLREWKGFEIEQRRQFPDLVTSAASSSSTGAYAAITSGRVLNAKQSTHTSSNASRSSTTRVWDRVAQAANSGSGGHVAGPSGRAAAAQRDKFPPLGGVGSSTGLSKAPPGSRKTPWAGSGSTSTSSTPAFPGLPSSSASSSSSSLAPLRPFSVPASSISSSTNTPAPKLNTAAFPVLPTSANKREKVQVKGNVSLRNILGSTKEAPASKWGANGANGSSVGPASSAPGIGTATPVVTPGLDEGAGSSKGRGKGKQKQMLFTLGTFPT